jgi:hypothetical protein
MSEFEDGLRDALRDPGRDPGREEPREADEAFVSRVGAGMDRHEAWRAVGLSLAAAAAVVLIAMLAVAAGPALAELLRIPLEQTNGVTPMRVTRFVWTASPVAGVLLVGAVTVPLIRRRR